MSKTRLATIGAQRKLSTSGVEFREGLSLLKTGISGDNNNQYSLFE